MTRMWIFTLVLAGLATDGVLPGQTPSPDAAIDKGVTWLIGQQHGDGSWQGRQAEHYHGMTALAVYTLLKCGVHAEHPAIAAGIGYMRTRSVHRIYDLGCYLMAYAALPEKMRPQDAVKDLVRKTLRTLGNGRRDAKPRWGYPFDHGENRASTWTDLSNTQYALLGLRAALQCEAKVAPPSFWTRIAEDLVSLQESYGGFGYQEGKKPSASMTVAGMGALAICREALGTHISKSLQGKIRTALTRGSMWLEKNWSVTGNKDMNLKDQWNNQWYYYYLYGLERLGAFAEIHKIGPHDWYLEGSQEILKRQHGNGSWGGDDDSCFSLLFLRRGSRTTPTAERKRVIEAGKGPATVTIGGDGENPTTAWLSALSPDLRERLNEGAYVESLRWEVDGDVVATIPEPKREELLTPRCNLSRYFEQNGAHKLRALLDVVTVADAKRDVIASNALEVRVDNVQTVWQRESLQDAGRNLLALGTTVTVTASSHLPGHPPEHVNDERFGTSWRTGEKDPGPWIELRLDPPVQAGVLKVCAAGPAQGGDAWSRPRDVAVRINGGRPMERRLHDTTHRKQTLDFTRTSVRSVRIDVKSWYPGQQAAGPGFKEIELLRDLTTGQAEETLRPTTTEWVLPLASQGESSWRFTLDAPGPTWSEFAFDDMAWRRGSPGFGNHPSAELSQRTEWSTQEIWIRREFTLSRVQEGTWHVMVNHDDDAQVFINGILAADAKGFSNLGYRNLVLSPKAFESLRSGRNSIAVHCANTGGPGFIDAALVIVQ